MRTLVHPIIGIIDIIVAEIVIVHVVAVMLLYASSAMQTWPLAEEERLTTPAHRYE